MASIVTNIIPANSRKNTTGKPQKTFTVRYRNAAGKQREKTFKVHDDAKKFVKAQDYKSEFEQTDVDLKAGKELFNDVVEAYLHRLPVIGRTLETYMSTYRTYVKPAYAGKTVREASQDRGLAEQLLNVDMRSMSIGPRRTARMMITGALDSAVASGKIDSHRLAGIVFAKKNVIIIRTQDSEGEDEGFIHLTDEQVSDLAKRCGIWVWLQRCMGLRVAEALGVEKSDFIRGGKVLRLRYQASRDGQSLLPLKHRTDGQFRDIPVPAFIWDMVKDMPSGPLCPGPRGSRYVKYNTAWDRFRVACKKLGIPVNDRELGIKGITTHSLRHMYATDNLARGMNIANLAKWLGHKDASVTLRVYVHETSDAMDEAFELMNERWSRPVLKAA